jgi:D-alanine-D-alanine ligase
MHMKYRIVLLSGGRSDERDVSLVSAAKIAEALEASAQEVIIIDPADYPGYVAMMNAIKAYQPDIVFNGLHGAEGEDGRIQSLLSLEGIPFTGSGYRASALAMDKYRSGLIAQIAGLHVPPKLALTSMDAPALHQFVAQYGLPVVVKPNDSGSSVGISLVQQESHLMPAVEAAFACGKLVLVEQFIPGRELTVTILGERILPVVEIRPHTGWYDYTNKYTKGNTTYEVPASLSDEETAQVQRDARAVYELLGCEVYARVDFRFDGKRFYFLEVNTLPGMTPLSLTPMAAQQEGISFDQLLMEIIGLSLAQERE